MPSLFTLRTVVRVADGGEKGGEMVLSEGIATVAVLILSSHWRAMVAEVHPAVWFLRTPVVQSLVFRKVRHTPPAYWQASQIASYDPTGSSADSGAESR